MTKEQQRNMYIVYTIIGVLIIIALIVWAVHVHRKNEAAVNPNGSAQGVTMNPTPTPTAVAPSPTSTGSGSAPAAASTYGAEVAAHPYRFQFVSCHGTPGTIDVAKGDVVMLDNRDSKTHTIKADGQTFTVAGYGWALLHTSVVETAAVTCDGGGAATLTVEK